MSQKPVARVHAPDAPCEVRRLLRAEVPHMKAWGVSEYCRLGCHGEGPSAGCACSGRYSVRSVRSPSPS
eukprot:9641315-Alexandrium_andersonii.AAC.1